MRTLKDIHTYIHTHTCTRTPVASESSGTWQQTLSMRVSACVRVCVGVMRHTCLTCRYISDNPAVCAALSHVFIRARATPCLRNCAHRHRNVCLKAVFVPACFAWHETITKQSACIVCWPSLVHSVLTGPTCLLVHGLCALCVCVCVSVRVCDSKPVCLLPCLIDRLCREGAGGWVSATHT